MQMVNKVEVLRAMLFTTEDFNTILNQVDFPQFNSYDLEFMIEFKKIFELGEPQLRKFITKLDAEGSFIDAYSINYYTSILKAGPFGNMVRDILGDPNSHQYWKSLPDSVGRNADNNHTASNTAGYPDSPQYDGADLRLGANMPNGMRVTQGRALSSVNSVFYSSVASATTTDNSFVKQDPQTTYEKAQDGTLQQTAHGGYWVRDVSFLKKIQEIAGDIQDAFLGLFTSEDQRMLAERNTGYLANEIGTTTISPQQSASSPSNPSINPLFVNVENPLVTLAPQPIAPAPPPSPAGQQYMPSANDQDNIAKIFKMKKKVVDNNKERTIELDLYGNEFDSDARRERLLKIVGKDTDKNVNLNTEEGQLGNVGNPDSTELTQTTMSPFNRGPQAAGLFPSEPFSSGGVAQQTQPTQPSSNADGTPIEVPRVNIGSVDLAARKAFLSGLPEGHKNQNGLITITSYGQGDDPYGDKGTRKRCGFADNLISEGSVALSPAFVKKFQPARGQLVIINGVAIGYYDDHAPDRFRSKRTGQWVYYGYVVDVYDPFNQIGQISKNGGQSFNVTFGDVRQHVHNPNCKNIG